MSKCKVSVFCSPVCDIEVRTIISNSSDSDQVECIIPVAEDRVQLNLSCKVDVSGEQVEILHSPGNNESTEFHLVGQCVADVCTSAAPNVYNVTYKTGFGFVSQNTFFPRNTTTFWVVSNRGMGDLSQCAELLPLSLIFITPPQVWVFSDYLRAQVCDTVNGGRNFFFFFFKTETRDLLEHVRTLHENKTKTNTLCTFKLRRVINSCC